MKVRLFEWLKKDHQELVQFGGLVATAGAPNSGSNSPLERLISFLLGRIVHAEKYRLY